MRLAILSRNKSLHSIRRLLTEADRLGVTCDVINPLECQLIVDNKRPRIQVGNDELPHFDAVLPRIGASVTDYGLAVVRHFEAMGTLVMNGSDAIARSRDKMSCLQRLSEKGIAVPPTVLSRSTDGVKTALETFKQLPVVLKVLRGTQGVGVMLVHTPLSLSSVVDTLRGLGEDALMQKFLADAAGRDYRIIVIGKKVIASMIRKASEGEFRSNIHRGGAGTSVQLPNSFARVSIKSCQALGLTFAGVDIMASRGAKRGLSPVVLEVNSSPGFEGIEEATGLNIAKLVIEEVIEQVNKRRAKRKKPRRK